MVTMGLSMRTLATLSLLMISIANQHIMIRTIFVVAQIYQTKSKSKCTWKPQQQINTGCPSVIVIVLCSQLIQLKFQWDNLILYMLRKNPPEGSSHLSRIWTDRKRADSKTKATNSYRDLMQIALKAVIEIVWMDNKTTITTVEGTDQTKRNK